MGGSPPKLLSNTPFRIGVTALLAATAISWLAWLCARNPEISFLTPHPPAQWIVFPSPPNPGLHLVAPLDAVFKGEFALTQPPRSARLSIRAARAFELSINGKPLPIQPPRNWKGAATCDALPYLKPGTNAILVNVFNAKAPPALWLSLDTDTGHLWTGPGWQASWAGSAWRDAVLASAANLPGPGNPAYGGTGILNAIHSVWPVWAVFAVGAAGLWAAGRFWLNRSRPDNQAAPARSCGGETAVVLFVFALIWIALFIHNTRLLPPLIGFDSTYHMEYIRYIQERWAVPGPAEGFEMFQPPLYYGLCAVLLEIFHQSMGVPAETVLRMLGLCLGIANLTLVFLGLRLLLDGKRGAQLAGLVLAACLPMHLYLSHYTTNEILTTTLVIGTMYLCLRLLKTASPTRAQYIGLGLCLGAALLTKATAVLLAPFVFGALGLKLAGERARPVQWIGGLGSTLIACLLVCGWYYGRIWLHYGTPLVGNWDAASGFTWWQDPGYRTIQDYTRFGRSLWHPLFSSFAGIWDGIYSTLWGDGLCGGALDLVLRPAWNYRLVTAGYGLAVVPTLLMLCGAGVTIRRFLVKPAREQLVPLGFFLAVAFGLTFMTLKVPSYGQAKAFYGLSALLSLCWFGAVGWDVLTRNSRILQFALGTLLLVWGMNSIAAMWIRSAGAEAHRVLGIENANEGLTNAAIAELTLAVKADPADGQTRRLLAFQLNNTGRENEALEEAKRAVDLDPQDSRVHLQLARILFVSGRRDQALAEAMRSVELGPENEPARQMVVAWLMESGRLDDALYAVRDALAFFPSDPMLHCALGLALEKKRDFPSAANQLKYAVSLYPRWAQAHLDLARTMLEAGDFAGGGKALEHAVQLGANSPVILNGAAWILATFPNPEARNGGEAVTLAEQARAMVGDQDSKLMGTLAAAYAEAGRFADAIQAAERAVSLAHASGDASAAKRNEDMLQQFRTSHPYHQQLALP